ncbi:hypothetical protein BGX38DRAFT_1283939 [Terfezia claveryi]|nr:hypothetical protein BGX38DRAFT_1283939 [Terfezia claveryi]
MAGRSFSLINGQLTYVPPVGFPGVANIAVHFGADGAINGASLDEVNLKRKRGQADAGAQNLEPQGPEEVSVAWLATGVYLTRPIVGKRRRGEASPGCVLPPPWEIEVRVGVEKKGNWGDSRTIKRARYTYNQCDSMLPAAAYGRQKWIVRVGRKFRGKTAYTPEGRVVEYAVNFKSEYQRRSTGFERTWRTPTGVLGHRMGYASQQGTSVAASVRVVGVSAEVTVSANTSDVTRVLAGPSSGDSVGQSGSDAHSAFDISMEEASAEDVPTSVATEAPTSTELDMGEAPQGDGQQSNEVSQEMELDDAAPGPCKYLSSRVGEITTFRGGELRWSGRLGTPRQGTYMVTEEEDHSAVPRRGCVYSDPQVGTSTEAVQLYCSPVTAALALPPFTGPVSAGGKPSSAMNDDDDEDIPDAAESKTETVVEVSHVETAIAVEAAVAEVPPMKNDDDEDLPDATESKAETAVEVSHVETAIEVEAAVTEVPGGSSTINVPPSMSSTPETSGAMSEVSVGYAVEAVESSLQCPQGPSQSTPLESSSPAMAPGVESTTAFGPEMTTAVARPSLLAPRTKVVPNPVDDSLALAMGSFELRATAPLKPKAEYELAGLLSGLDVSTSSPSNFLRKDHGLSKRLTAVLASKAPTPKRGGIQKLVGKKVRAGRKPGRGTAMGKGNNWRDGEGEEEEEEEEEEEDEEVKEMRRRAKGKGRAVDEDKDEEEELRKDEAEEEEEGEDEGGEDENAEMEKDEDEDGYEGDEDEEDEDGEGEDKENEDPNVRMEEDGDEDEEDGDDDEEDEDDNEEMEEEEGVIQIVAQADGEEEEDSDTPAAEIILGDDEEL